MQAGDRGLFEWMDWLIDWLIYLMDGCSLRALALTRGHNLLKNARWIVKREGEKFDSTTGGGYYLSPNSNNPSKDAYSSTALNIDRLQEMQAVMRNKVRLIAGGRGFVELQYHHAKKCMRWMPWIMSKDNGAVTKIVEDNIVASNMVRK